MDGRYSSSIATHYTALARRDTHRGQSYTSSADMSASQSTGQSASDSSEQISFDMISSTELWLILTGNALKTDDCHFDI